MISLLCIIGPNSKRFLQLAFINCGYIVCVPWVGLKWTLMRPDPLVCFHCLVIDQKSTQNKFPCCLYFEVCFPAFMAFGSEESFWYFQIQSEIMATIILLTLYFDNILSAWGKVIINCINFHHFVHFETHRKMAKGMTNPTLSTFSFMYLHCIS